MLLSRVSYSWRQTWVRGFFPVLGLMVQEAMSCTRLEVMGKILIMQSQSREILRGRRKLRNVW